MLSFEMAEKLRGEPIKLFEGNPLDIPCIETSDAKKLCKNPVVSVCMVTYNHEQYIRQAIEGVMMQRTDFEFELVIGEDCSTDKTREICFEYQKKYPDKVRVLWCNYNLYRNPHPAGENGARTMAHCRGEFIAFCEGDDYWIDPLKLQKQVEVMQKHNNVSICFCNSNYYYQKTKRVALWDGAKIYDDGLISSDILFKMATWGVDVSVGPHPDAFIMTATVMFRRESFERAKREFDIFSWGLRLGDLTLWLALSMVGDAYYVSDVVSVYRRHEMGLTMSVGNKLFLDGAIVRLYFSMIYASHHHCKVPFIIFSELLASRIAAHPSIDRHQTFKVFGELFKHNLFSFRMSTLRNKVNWIVLKLTGCVGFMLLPLNPRSIMRALLKNDR